MQMGFSPSPSQFSAKPRCVRACVCCRGCVTTTRTSQAYLYVHIDKYSWLVYLFVCVCEQAPKQATAAPQLKRKQADAAAVSEAGLADGQPTAAVVSQPPKKKVKKAKFLGVWKGYIHAFGLMNIGRDIHPTLPCVCVVDCVSHSVTSKMPRWHLSIPSMTRSMMKSKSNCRLLYVPCLETRVWATVQLVLRPCLLHSVESRVGT
jgi:hypothetical protein